MKKILIVYASSTGNTEEIACMLRDGIDDQRFLITMKNIEESDIGASELLDYDGILFGSYTYDDGDLPFATEFFSDELESIDLHGKVVGVFGSGDRAYADFCQAVDSMKEQFQRLNASVIGHTVKVDLFPDEDEEINAIDELNALFQQALNGPAAGLSEI